MALFNIKEYGAKGDGISNDTASVQEAIDQCSENGGGKVIIPPGEYLCGTIWLKSNINFHLQAGAVIKCSTDPKDIKTGKFNQRFRDNSENKGVFIEAYQSDNISITGLGVIDGQGDQFMEPPQQEAEFPLTPKKFRPSLCIFLGCNNIKIRDVTFKNSALWGLHLAGCDTVNISGITIKNNLRGPNTDGIDPDCSKNVHISNCEIESGDDSIVLKTTRKVAREYGSCENITVSNCTLISRSSAVKIGTETHSDIRNCVFNNCIIRDSNRGIGIWVRDNSVIENIIFSNFVIESRLIPEEENGERDWWGRGEPIFISAEYRNDSIKPGLIKNIRFQNIFAESESCIYLGAIEKNLIENIKLSNIDLKLEKKTENEGGVFDVRPSRRKSLFYHDIPALYLNNINEIDINKFKVNWDPELPDYYNYLIYGKEIRNFSIDGFTEKNADNEDIFINGNKFKGIEKINC